MLEAIYFILLAQLSVFMSYKEYEKSSKKEWSLILLVIAGGLIGASIRAGWGEFTVIPFF